MARPRKKPDYDPEQVVKEFLGAVADAFGSYVNILRWRSHLIS